MKKLFCILLSILTILLLASCNLVIKDSLETVQERNNTLDITIAIPADTLADRIVVSSVMMNSMNMPVYRSEKEYKDYKGGDISYNVGYYGKHEVTIKLYSGNTERETITREYIVTASDYNIALLSATVPVTYTSLMLADQNNTTNPINSTFPTIITLERADAYNWNALLENMTDCPFIDGYKTGNNSFQWPLFVDAYRNYVKYLHGLNPSSKFHFIFNDFDAGLIPFIAFDAGLTVNEFSTVLISDGSGTYSLFSSIFGDGSENDNSIETYENIESIWENVKKLAQSGDASYVNILKSYSDNSYGLDRYMRNFPAILINDPDLDIKWIVNRKNADVFGSSKVYLEKVSQNSNLMAVNMNNLLNALTEEEKEQFARLFSLNLDAFSEADRQSKKIMIFLGTRNDQSLHLEEFISFFTNYYGQNDYALFYKGHPGDLTENNSGRSSILSSYGWNELDAQIPAELFYFFRKDAIMGGYQSSTYDCGVDISFITFNGSMSDLAYLERAEGYVEIDSKGFHVVKNDGTSCYWDPSSPSTFNFE